MAAEHETAADWRTPFERGNGNQTTTWEACIAFHERLASSFPSLLRFEPAGRSDGGLPLHLGVFSADGCFDPAAIKAAGRTVLFNNNGIHPGEPEGIDVNMALLRDLCTQPALREKLQGLVLVYIPVYNVDGAINRADTSRVNQLGPEQFGFRGSARHLDLNRDFIKLQSRNARSFAAAFTRWDPDLLFDTHTSNGADYQHTMTLIATQPDKLGGRLAEHLREQMLPALYAGMAQRGWPMCPYVNPIGETPDDGIVDFLDLPRFSTGYAALHHTIGFMPETHMLKPYADRYASMRALFDGVIEHAAACGAAIRACRAADRAAVVSGAPLPLNWQLDQSRSSSFEFLGFEATHAPSRLGNYQRLRYDRQRPYRKAIPWYDRFLPVDFVEPPRAYLLPQAWPEVAERLQANGVAMRRVEQARMVSVEALRFTSVDKAASPYEGHHLHRSVALRAEAATVALRPGDWIVPMGQACDRYIVETLEPQAADSFFRWGFFDAVLDRKENFSDYVFEDEAERLLASEAGLRERFERWCAEHPGEMGSAEAVLGFIHRHCQRYAEPEFMRYPIFRVRDAETLKSIR